MNIVGIDEVGHGAIAGPVVVCAYMSDDPDSLLYYKDSKGLKKTPREAYDKLYRELALEFYIISIDNFYIDKTSPYHARNRAIELALRKFTNPIHMIIMDGIERISPTSHERYKRIIKYVPQGDKKHWQVAAASILAKVTRDDYMTCLSDQYPIYGWKKNSGYSHPVHLEAIAKHGPSPYHRMTNAAVKASMINIKRGN